MSDSTPGTPAPETGARDQGPSNVPAGRARSAASRDDHAADDDVAIHDDLGDTGGGAPGGAAAGPRAAGDALGSGSPTGHDGTMGTDAPAGDASLAEPAVSTAAGAGAGLDEPAMPGGPESPDDVYGGADDGAVDELGDDEEE